MDALIRVLFLLAAGGLGALASRRFFGTVLAPLGLMSVCWWGPLALYATGVVDYEPLAPRTWLIFVTGYASFAVGCVLFAPTFASARTPSRSEPAFQQSRERIHLTVFLLTTGIALLATGVQFLAAFQLGRYGELRTVREVFNLHGWDVAYCLNFITPALGYLYWKRYKRWRLVVLLALLLTALALLVVAQKRNFITAAVMALIAAQFVGDRPSGKVLGIIAILGTAFFVGYSQLVSPYYGGDWRFLVANGRVHLPQQLAFLSNPLVYVTAGFPAFNAFLQQGGGIGPFRGESLIAFTNLLSKFDPLIAQPSNIYDSVTTLVVPVNVFTYLRPFYVDFGMLGVILFPGLLGTWTTFLFYQASRTRTTTAILLYTVWAWPILVVSFSNHFIYTLTFLASVMVVSIGYVVDGPSQRLKPGRASAVIGRLGPRRG